MSTRLSRLALVLLALTPTAALAQDGGTKVALSQLASPVQVMLFLSFVAIAIGIMSSGLALSISLAAYAACERDNRGAAFIPALMPGSQGLYSFAICFLMLQNLGAGTDPVKVAFAGVACGIPCMWSAIGQARTAAACIKSINNGTMDGGQALLATGIPELYALSGLAVGFLAMVL